MKNKIVIIFILFIIPAVILAYTSDKKHGRDIKMKITASAFDNEEMIPALYTCKGKDISPEISWKEVPEKAKSLVLICDDPDAPAGTWVHWVLYNIPVELKGLPEDVSDAFYEDNGIMSGINSAHEKGYHGPCPPSGTHRYYFKLYALDTVLDFKGKVPSKKDIVEATEGHVIDKAVVMGTFKK